MVVGECIGRSDFDYGNCIVRLMAYRTRCDTESLRCTDHSSSTWLHPSDMGAIGLAPADAFLRPRLLDSGPDLDESPSVPLGQ